MVSLRIESGQAPNEALKGIALDLVNDALRHLSDEPDKKDVHEVRKRFKEIRAILRLVEGSLDDRGEAARTLFRNAGRQLAARREADALAETFEKLGSHFGDEWESPPFIELRSLLVQHADAPPVDFVEIQSRIIPAREEIARWSPDRTSFKRGLRTVYRSARRRMRDALRSRSPLAFHNWRKRAKDHWYHNQIIERALPEEMANGPASLRDLSRVLGDHHDLAVLLQLCDHSEKALATATNLGVISRAEKRMRELEEEAAALGRLLFEERPRRWIRRFEGCWDKFQRSGDVDHERIGPKRARSTPHRTPHASQRMRRR